MGSVSDERVKELLPEGLESAGAVNGGYEVLVRYQGWRAAVITWAERFDRKNLYRLERHMETDEVFVLMAGEAVLYIGQEGTSVKMEPYRAYNVKCGIWHNISVSSDAKVFICENIDTGVENTEYMEWSPE